MMYVQLFAGFVLLLGGAEFMVRGAVALARRLGISPLVIGMTVIAFGTSAPELVVCVNAALSGAPGIALGNVIGSNTANILLILGAAGVLMPVAAGARGLTGDGWVLVGGSVLFAALCWPATLGPVAGGVLLATFFAFLWYSYRRQAGGGAAQSPLGQSAEVRGWRRSTLLTWAALLGGIAGVVLGADLLVEGGVAVARTMGVPEEIIGLTLIAIGTSLPELAASVVAALRGHAEVVLGNVIGSNLFNLLGVAGTTALVAPLPVADQIRGFDIWVMLAATAVLFVVLLGKWRIGRPLAALFLVAYVAYIGVLTGLS